MSANKRRNLIFGGALALVVILLASGLALRSCARGNRFDRYYAKAEQAYLDDNFDKAVEYLDKAMEIDSTEACYLLMSDIYYYGMKDIDEAINVLYVGSYKLGGEAIAARLEELKAERTNKENSDEGKIKIGENAVAPEATSLSLAKQGLSDADIADIGKLEYLESLTLTGNRLTALGPVAQLSRLTSLYIGDNQIKSIADISKLQLLKTLYLDGNPLEDLTPLHSLKNLTTLSLKGIEISTEELEALKEALPECSIFCDETEDEVVEITLGGVTFMSDVQELDLGGKNITDITELAKCTKLKKLDLRSNSISDLSPLTGLTELEWLCVWSNKISDIRPLVPLTRLAYLDADANSISDIGALGSLTALSELWLSYNPLSGIEALSNLTGLTRLGLKGVGLEDSDLDILAKLIKLTELLLDENTGLSADKVDELKTKLPSCTVSAAGLLYKVSFGGQEFTSDATEIIAVGAGVSDISALSHFTALTSLVVSDNSIADISALASCTQLTSLEIANNAVSDLTALASCTKLHTLNLTNNRLTSVSALSGLTGLVELRLDNNKIPNLSPLASLTSLTRLSLSYCSLEDISVLAGLTKLSSLNLQGNNISDIEPLLGLASLTTLDISNNNLTSTQVMQLRESLPQCQIITDVLVDAVPSETGRNTQ